MNYLIEVLFLAVNLVMAFWQAQLIKQNRPIIHGLWGLAYAALLVAVYFLTKHPIVVICLVLVREVVFAPALNYFRHLGFFYTSPSSTSVLDKWEGKYYIPIYLASAAALIILQFFL